MEKLTIDKISKVEESDSISDVDPVRKSIKYGTTFQAAKGIMFEYFNDSSIHGLKYISDPKRSAMDRCIWLCALITSIVTCCFLIADSWKKNSTNPVIITIDEKSIPVWEIPFPSVTICPETKSHTKIFNYTGLYWKLEQNDNYTFTDEEIHFNEAISQTCYSKLTTNSTYKSSSVVNASDLIDAFLKASPSRNETFYECAWNKEYNCNKLFDYVLTEDGLCFTFNLLRIENYRKELYDSRQKEFSDYNNNNTHLEWNLERGYNENASAETFPFRVLGSGVRQSLFVFLGDKKEDEDLLCRGYSQGFKVMVHTPGEEPQVSKNFINIPFDKSVSISIIPDIVKASDGLRGYPPKRRQCYYQNEVYLRYYKVYSQANCELECLANETLARCGCVNFAMPRNSSHLVCGLSNESCVSDVKSDSLIKKFELRSHQNQFRNITHSCYNNYCLPTCFSIKYNAFIEHQIEYSFAKELKALGVEDNGISNTRLARLMISFNDDAFISLRRSELYSITDFIASCGGLLGLFMGVSILSLVELVYYFTVRLWMNLKTRRRKHLKSSED